MTSSILSFGREALDQKETEVQSAPHLLSLPASEDLRILGVSITANPGPEEPIALLSLNPDLGSLASELPLGPQPSCSPSSGQLSSLRSEGGKRVVESRISWPEWEGRSQGKEQNLLSTQI